MNVEILVDGPYGKFDLRSGKQTTQVLKKGDVVEFPDPYALDLIASQLAKPTKQKLTKDVAGETVFEQDLDSEKSLVEQMAAVNTERHPKEEATAKEVTTLLKGRKRG